MTYEHVLAATKTSSDAFNATLAFVNHMLSGKMPRHPSLLDSSLVGLQKPDGGVRPIAIGEALYRIAGLCAMTACEDIGRSLAPLQLAVGVSGGVEALVHAVRSALAADPDAALLTVDMANAYNTVDRSALFAAVQRHVPSLLAYVQWSYGAPTDLHIVGASADTAPVSSCTGLRQGDTLAQFLFGLVLQPVLERTRDAAPAVAVLAIADDANLVGTTDSLRAAFRVLTGAEGAAGIGLRVQQRKCAITAGPLHAVAQLAAELGVQHRPEGVTVCGTPIGTDAFVLDALSQRADAVIAQVDKLMRLPATKQAQFILLRSSLSLRMAHLLRTVPWELLGPSTRRVEHAITQAAAALFQLPTRGGGAGGRTAEQLALPLRHAGFGLRVVTPVEADAAHVAGASKAQAAMKEGLESCKPFEGALRPVLLATWLRVFDAAAADCEWEPSARDLPAEFVREVLPLAQRLVSRVIGDRAGADFLAACDVDTAEGRRDAARIRSAGNGPASAWLTALPVTPVMQLSNADFVMAGRHRLGLGVASPVDMPPCPCSSGDSALPDHAMSCNKYAGEASMRHNSTTSVWRQAMRRAGISTSGEPLYSSLAPEGARGAAGNRRGDILAVMPDGRSIVFDCVVTHPAAASYVRDAAHTDGSAAAKAELRKQRAFDEFAPGSAYEFRPLAVESYGRLGTVASRFLSELGDIASQGSRVSKAAFVRGVKRELSCALCKGNARLYYKRLSSIASHIGSHYLPGCDTPVEDPGEV